MGRCRGCVTAAAISKLTAVLEKGASRPRGTSGISPVVALCLLCSVAALAVLCNRVLCVDA
jgi:hypothetical protein